MTGKFVLEIEMGNDGMRKRAHVRDALKEIANKVFTPSLDTEGVIKDDNGNVVGKGEFKKD